MTRTLAVSLANRRHLLLGALCVVVAVLFAGKGLGDESYVYTHGDSPRYMMNAMYILDVLRDRPFGSLDIFRDYSTLYYARYPALSLGHHAPLTSVLEVPFLALMGPTVTAARMPIILSFGVCALFLYLLVADLSDEWSGLLAGLVLASSPGLVELSQGVMSEAPSLALSLVAAYALHRFCVTERRTLLVAFAVSATLSVWAKQNGIVAFPAFAAYACARLGWRRLLHRDLLATLLAVSVLSGVFVAATAAVGSGNVRQATFVVRAAVGDAQMPPGVARRAVILRTVPILRSLPYQLASQMTGGMATLGVVGLVLLVLRRRPEAWLFGVWTLSTLAFICVVTRQQEIWRYGIYWVPALAAGAGLLCSTGPWRPRVAAVVIGVLLVQLSVASRWTIQSLGGYEEAARFVVEQPRGSTVMFSGDIDTGYFIFYLRKHDTARRQIVLRSDKIFTVSDMKSVAAMNRVDSPDQIGPTLQQLGVGYVVIEDRPSESAVQEWLRAELRGADYIERRRLPIRTTDYRLRGTDLVVYEVKNPHTPGADARLDLRLPIVSRQLDVPLADLLGRKYLR